MQMPDFSLAIPEMWVLAMACVVLVADLFDKSEDHGLAYYLSQVTLLVAIVLTIDTQWGVRATTFSDMFRVDPLAVVLKVAIETLGFIAFAYSREYLQARNLLRGEYFVLGLFGVLGMMAMASGYSLLTLYMGLELLSLSLYAMVAINRDAPSASEAAMKYFVLGALSSGMLLYGMSMVYGAVGSLDISRIAAVSMASGSSNLLLIFGLAFVIVGVSFKFGAVPFHMWVPDVYEGAPTPVTLYIGTAPKVAAVALFLRLLSEGLGGLQGDWQLMMIVLAVLSLAVGNIFALAQTNMKRMLAYSTISHVGFLFLGFIAGSKEGYSAAVFYAVSYTLTAAGAFGMILLLSRKGFEADRIEDFKGLNERSGTFAIVMLVIMFSMTGVPGTVGFYAKWLVLKSIVDAGMTWLAVVSVIFAVIGAFYYLRVLKMVFFDKPQGEAEIEAGTGLRAVLGVNGLAVLLLGIFPSALIGVCM
ncbi:MAG TPA: NADH-quinone oxidoreductase subunit NuoN, partial [Pseudomonadales bacterium]|nr:NADH-quinone oxidoreductase subunit NuoN [Pseudomonadales bacterium]